MWGVDSGGLEVKIGAGGRIEGGAERRPEILVYIYIYDCVYLFFARALYVIQKACFFSRDATELQLQTKDMFFKSPKPDLR